MTRSNHWFTNLTPRQQFILDCASISSGTLASLTGKTKYSELDAIQVAWLIWLETAEVETFKSWRSAWQAWQELTNDPSN